MSAGDSVNAVQNTFPLSSKIVLQNPPLQECFFLQHCQTLDSVTNCVDVFPLRNVH